MEERANEQFFCRVNAKRNEREQRWDERTVMWGEEEKRLEEMEEEDDGVKEGEEGAEQEFNKVSRKKKMTGMRQSHYSTAHHQCQS